MVIKKHLNYGFLKLRLKNFPKMSKITPFLGKSPTVLLKRKIDGIYSL